MHAVGVTSEGLPFYAMKLVKGKTLAEMISDYHATQEPDAEQTHKFNQMIQILVAVCNAAAFAHSRGILHRDIKPGNIMVGDYGETLLMDWGLAKVLPDHNTTESKGDVAQQPGFFSSSWYPNLPPSPHLREATRQGTVCGTLAYMSPEQARGEVDSLDNRSDVFSIGATLYTLLVGETSYSGKGQAAVELVRQGRFPNPRKIKPSVPRALEAICLKAMAFAPEDRYSSATELAVELVRWQSGEPVQAYPEPWPKRTARWIRKHRTFCVASAVAAGVLTLALVAAKVHSDARDRAIASEAWELLREGQEYFNRDKWNEADNKFYKVQTQIAGIDGLSELRNELKRWSHKTNTKIVSREARIRAQSTLKKFRQLCDKAVLHGMLGTGILTVDVNDAEEHVKQAKQSAEDALNLFSLRSEVSGKPQLHPAHFEPEEAKSITDACRQLRWIYVDTVAQPLAAPSSGQDHATAQKALELLDHIDDAQQDSPYAYWSRKASYLQHGGDTADYEEAKRQAKDAIPRSAEDRFLLGSSCYSGERYREALRHFEETMRLDPNHFWAQFLHGACLTRLQRWQEAANSLTAAINRRSDVIYGYLVRGYVYGRLGYMNPAIEDFERAKQIDSMLPGIYLNRGVVYLQQADVHEQRGDAYLQQGLVDQQHRDVEAANEAFAKALDDF